MLLPGPPFPLLVQVGLDLIDEGPAVLRTVVGVNRQPRALVHQKNVFILVDDIQLGGSHRQVGIVLPGGIEELVVDVELKGVPRFQPGIPLGPGTVALDALQPDILLGQGGRKQGHCLGQKPIQPLPGIVGPDGQFFHGLLPSISAKWRLI